MDDSQSPNWPGERRPSRQDVIAANERPDAGFFSDFKRALMASGDAVRNEKLLHMDFQLQVRMALSPFVYSKVLF